MVKELSMSPWVVSRTHIFQSLSSISNYYDWQVRSWHSGEQPKWQWEQLWNKINCNINDFIYAKWATLFRWSIFEMYLIDRYGNQITNKYNFTSVKYIIIYSSFRLIQALAGINCYFIPDEACIRQQLEYIWDSEHVIGGILGDELYSIMMDGTCEDLWGLQLFIVQMIRETGNVYDPHD